MQINCIPSGALGVNTYYVRDEITNKGFILDPGGFSPNMLNLIKQDDCTIQYIILTHGHGDHIGGVQQYMEAFPNAQLVACIHEKALLADPRLNMSRECGGAAVALEADLWVDDGETLQIGEMSLKFIHTPGHTEGGMCILIDNILFSGDTLFQQSIGRTDFPGGSFTAIKNSIHNKLFVLPDETTVYPGHMGSTNIGFEKRNNPFV
ncbi:MBL fold metallo-hydrolase [Clostridium aminobutyricum]|uniref:MBL fold metallo-hydrolase n=1 Tax=Clostridium aminobutyricum TaxID=33953 RepID=A0A939IIF7_CLOAM|nr:MBL fold metallo-hydrolase [Clostridium aminobutyricum]MBN7772439.1 MBL fold metallo-hydrolase [Clostridium aminobutyricum]